MSEPETTAMHPDFPRWYAEVDVEQNRDRMTRRFRGVSELNRALTIGDVETMVRIVFNGRPNPSAESLSRIRKPFNDADDLFEMQGNMREMEILCASALAILAEKNTDKAAIGALSVTTAILGGARVLRLPMDLPAIAERAISRMAENHRKRPPLRDLAAAAHDLDSAAEDALANLSTLFTESIQNLETFITIQDEELQMLWWTFGERSNDFDCPFGDVPRRRQPFVFGKELADLTEFSPGPASSKALLARAGLQDIPAVTIPEAVNACEVAWLGLLHIQQDVSPVSAPLHSAIHRKLETGDEASWIAGWAAICGIDQNYSLPGLVLGNLFYRERLLTKLIGA
jgi:GTPase-associated system helical domain